jgi:hypothetical protein
MSRGLIFWILMLIWFVFGLVWHFGLISGGYGILGGALLLFILFALLGWQVFGPPIHG